MTPAAIVANRRIDVDRAGQVPGEPLVAGDDRGIEPGELPERLDARVAAGDVAS